MHGMPVAFLTGLVDNVNSFPGFKDYSSCLTPKDFVYIGLRDVDKYEKELMRSLGMKAFTVRNMFVCYTQGLIVFVLYCSCLILCAIRYLIGFFKFQFYMCITVYHFVASSTAVFHIFYVPCEYLPIKSLINY